MYKKIIMFLFVGQFIVSMQAPAVATMQTHAVGENVSNAQPVSSRDIFNSSLKKLFENCKATHGAVENNSLTNIRFGSIKVQETSDCYKSALILSAAFDLLNESDKKDAHKIKDQALVIAEEAIFVHSKIPESNIFHQFLIDQIISPEEYKKMIE